MGRGSGREQWEGVGGQRGRTERAGRVREQWAGGKEWRQWVGAECGGDSGQGLGEGQGGREARGRRLEGSGSGRGKGQWTGR